uniref:Uncharacterized protein n=1 Tax=Parascaris equorum TaxID=6256 RepID=A0A914RPM7_PAREQ
MCKWHVNRIKSDFRDNDSALSVMVAEMTPPTSEAVPLIGKILQQILHNLKLKAFLNRKLLSIGPLDSTLGDDLTPIRFLGRGSTLSLKAVVRSSSRASSHDRLPVRILSGKHDRVFFKKAGDKEWHRGGGKREYEVKYLSFAIAISRALHKALFMSTAVEFTAHSIIQLISRSGARNSDEITDYLVMTITRRIEDEEESQRLQNDWKFAAMVVDRACLISIALRRLAEGLKRLLTLSDERG